MEIERRERGPRPETARVFFALWPDKEVRRALERPARDCARLLGGRAMRPDTLHLTLAFIGDVAVDRLPALQDAAAAVAGASFSFTLDRLGFWAHNRIVWAGSRQPAAGLAQLAGALGECLRQAGWPGEAKAGQDFAPHVTLVRKVGEQRPQLPPLPPLAWHCRRFVLVRSRLSAAGADYETLAQWPLA